MDSVAFVYHDLKLSRVLTWLLRPRIHSGGNAEEMRRWGCRIPKESSYTLVSKRELDGKDSYHKDLFPVSFISFGRNLLMVSRLHLRSPLNYSPRNVYTGLRLCPLMRYKQSQRLVLKTWVYGINFCVYIILGIKSARFFRPGGDVLPLQIPVKSPVQLPWPAFASCKLQ